MVLYLLRAVVSLVQTRKPALAFIFVTLVLDVLGVGIIIPNLPLLVKSFSGGNTETASHAVGWLASLYSLMQFGFSPVVGSLSDRFGRRPVILTALLGSGLDYFLMAFAPNLGWFFVGRIVSGITGASFTAASAYIADISPPEKRAANFGIIGAAFGIGFIAGPALGGVLGGMDPTLRLPFFVAGGLTLVNWLYGVFVLPESLAPENRRQFSWGRSNPVGSLLALRRHPVAFGLAGTYFLVNVAHQALPSTWVLYTGERYHWTSRQVGISLAIVGLMAGIVQGGLTRFVVKRFGEARTAIFGLSIAVLNYAAYGLATEGWMIYAILIVGSVSSVTGPAVQGLISRNVGADEQGGVQGSLTSLMGVAGIIGPPLATSLFAYYISKDSPIYLPGAAFLFSSLLMLLAMLVTLVSFKRNAVHLTR